MKAEVKIKKEESRLLRPIELAKAICATKGINFEQKLIEHLASEYGAVVSRPDLFAMARVVALASSQCPHRQDADATAWHITMVVGCLTDLVRLFPFPLPFISFTRWKGHERLRIYPMGKFLSRSKRRTSNTEHRTCPQCFRESPASDAGGDAGAASSGDGLSHSVLGVRRSAFGVFFECKE